MTAEWTAPAVERADPDKVAAERRALEQWLDYHRDILLAKCAGLTAEQVQIPDETLRHIITRYTREAGCRNLERAIGRLSDHLAPLEASSERKVP